LEMLVAEEILPVPGSSLKQAIDALVKQGVDMEIAHDAVTNNLDLLGVFVVQTTIVVHGDGDCIVDFNDGTKLHCVRLNITFVSECGGGWVSSDGEDGSTVWDDGCG